MSLAPAVVGAGGAPPPGGAAVVADVSGVSLRYGRKLALDAIDLAIPAGRMVGLIGPDGVATAIREVNYGQPQTIRVASTAGFSDGDECWYQDVQPGDEVVIHAHATLSRTGAGTYRITANTPVTVEAQGEVLRRAGNAEWLPAEDAIPRGR